jgi:hypothetical protein
MGGLLALWFALIGADRLDFFAGNGPFILAPVLILTPVVVVLGTLRLLGGGGRFRVPANTGAYTLLATAFLAVVLVSVFYSYDLEMSVRRYALLAFQVYGTVLVALILAQRADARTVLVRGAYWGLLIGTVFNAFQIASFFVRSGDEFLLLGGVVDMTANVYGTWVPRLAGQAFDMNRGGILFLVYVAVLLRLAPRSKVRTLAVAVGVIGIVGSLSRSVLLGGIGVGLAIVFLEGRFSLSRRGAAIGALAVAGIAGMLMFSPRAVEVGNAVMVPIAMRFDMSEGSAGVHAELLERGIEVALESPKHALVGVGYGNSFAYVDDIFPDDKYGNFHSLYVTLLVESGGLALLAGLLLLGYPAFRGGTYRPLIMGLAFFNIFYQTGAEAVFWFVLVLGWTRLADPTLEPRTTPAPVPVPAPQERVPALVPPPAAAGAG